MSKLVYAFMAFFTDPSRRAADESRVWTPGTAGAYNEMTLFLGDFLILDSSVLFLGLIHCECLLVKDCFLIVELDGIRYRYWVIYDMTTYYWLFRWGQLCGMPTF